MVGTKVTDFKYINRFYFKTVFFFKDIASRMSNKNGDDKSQKYRYFDAIQAGKEQSNVFLFS